MSKLKVIIESEKYDNVVYTMEDIQEVGIVPIVHMLLAYLSAFFPEILNYYFVKLDDMEGVKERFGDD